MRERERGTEEVEKKKKPEKKKNSLEKLTKKIKFRLSCFKIIFTTEHIHVCICGLI